jgi:uncharacterized damage-inducible protein DinB
VPEHDDGRNAPVIVAGEIATCLAFLAYLRDAVCRKLDGLSDDQVRQAKVPSGTSLLGLVKHLTDVEVYWVQRRFAGLETQRRTDGFTVHPEDTVASVLGAYDDATRRTDQIVATCGDPDHPMALGTHGLTLRWVLAHVAEETARHAGHADIVRELIDGSTGR